MKVKPEYIYVAGALTASPADYLGNAGLMIENAVDILRRGHHVFVPCLDFPIYMFMKKNYAKHGDKGYYRESIAWLAKCDAIYLGSGWKYDTIPPHYPISLDDVSFSSNGVYNEYKYAKEHGLKIYWYLSEIPVVTDNGQG